MLKVRAGIGGGELRDVSVPEDVLGADNYTKTVYAIEGYWRTMNYNGRWHDERRTELFNARTVAGVYSCRLGGPCGELITLDLSNVKGPW